MDYPLGRGKNIEFVRVSRWSIRRSREGETFYYFSCFDCQYFEGIAVDVFLFFFFFFHNMAIKNFCQEKRRRRVKTNNGKLWPKLHTDFLHFIIIIIIVIIMNITATIIITNTIVTLKNCQLLARVVYDAQVIEVMFLFVLFLFWLNFERGCALRKMETWRKRVWERERERRGWKDVEWGNLINFLLLFSDTVSVERIKDKMKY